VAIAHPEGFPLAVANIYVDLAAAIRGEGGPGARPDGGRTPRPRTAALHGGGHAAVASAKARWAWVDARPPMFR
jgi:hypothetical protein